MRPFEHKIKLYRPLALKLSRRLAFWLAAIVGIIAIAFAIMPILFFYKLLPSSLPGIGPSSWHEVVPYYADVVQVLSIALGVIIYLLQSGDNRKSDSERGLANILRTYGEYLNACLQNPNLDVFDGAKPDIPTAFWKKKSYEQQRKILIIEAIYLNVIERFYLWAKAGGQDDSPEEYNSWMIHLKELFSDPEKNLPIAWKIMGHRYDEKFRRFVDEELKPKV